MERRGIPTAFITALPTIALQAGANRVLRGVSIAHPVSDPTASDEVAGRRAVVERALEMLETEIDHQQVWQVEGRAAPSGLMSRFRRG